MKVFLGLLRNEIALVQKAIHFPSLGSLAQLFPGLSIAQSDSSVSTESILANLQRYILKQQDRKASQDSLEKYRFFSDFTFLFSSFSAVMLFVVFVSCSVNWHECC